VPTTSVIRAAADAPPIGSTYAFASGRRQFVGVIVAHRALPRVAAHVAVVIELSDGDHRRLILGEHQ
jgi:hypothetical protein